MLRRRSWLRTLLLSIALKSTLTFTVSKPEICQLTECALPRSPVRFPPLAATFNMYSLRPVLAGKFPLSHRLRPGNVHLFDLFYHHRRRSQKDSADCFELNFMVSLQDDKRYLALHLGVECRGKGKVMFLYESSDVWRLNCIKPLPIHEGMFQRCNYHAQEQLRFTTVGNDTLLVEDLSAFVPPGTWVIFRAKANAGGRRMDQDRGQCRCRNLLRDRKRMERCIKYYRDQIDNEQRIREARERIVREFRIASVILMVSCCSTIVMRCWASRKIADFECITNFVYPEEDKLTYSQTDTS